MNPKNEVSENIAIVNVKTEVFTIKIEREDESGDENSNEFTEQINPECATHLEIKIETEEGELSSDDTPLSRNYGSNASNVPVDVTKTDNGVVEKESYSKKCEQRFKGKMMFDTEILIYEVEQRPCIWNTGDKSYSDKFLRDKAWQEVAVNCFGEWTEFNNDEKQHKIDFLQKKWKSIRDYYMREKKKENDERTGSAAKRKKVCPYFDLLHFLKTSKLSRPSSSSATPKNLLPEVEDNSIITKAPEPSRAPISMQKTQSPERKQADPSRSSLPRPINKKAMTPFQEAVLEKLNNDDVDANLSFLLSFLPEMSRMTERQNFEFRMEIMKALNKVKYKITDHSTN